MKSKLINLTHNKKKWIIDENKPELYHIPIPTINAYSIEYITAILSGKILELSVDCVKEKCIEIFSRINLNEVEIKLQIYYHGIREFELLFPSVNNQKLRIRLGEFYKESELAFDNGAWLSFVLMSGSIFEGVLYSLINKNETFQKLIDQALSNGLITTYESNIMHKVRNFRNLVHSSRYDEPFVPRADAMDVKRLLEDFITNQ
jgi:hypothetical protein